MEYLFHPISVSGFEWRVSYIIDNVEYTVNIDVEIDKVMLCIIQM